MTEDERAIRELVATWMSASRAGDTETVLGLIADDAEFMVVGQEPFGKERVPRRLATPEGPAHRGHRATSARSRCWATGPGCATT